MHRRSRLLHNRRHCVVSRLYRNQQLLRDALFPRGTPATEGRCFHSSEVSASPCPSQDRVVSADVGMCAERSDARAPLQRQSDAAVPLSTGRIDRSRDATRSRARATPSGIRSPLTCWSRTTRFAPPCRKNAWSLGPEYHEALHACTGPGAGGGTECAGADVSWRRGHRLTASGEGRSL